MKIICIYRYDSKINGVDCIFRYKYNENCFKNYFFLFRIFLDDFLGVLQLEVIYEFLIGSRWKK